MLKFQKILVAVIIFAALSGPAYAYIDPGSGSMIVQGILAAVATLALTAKLWWHRLLVFLHIRKPTIKSRRKPPAPGQ